MQVRTTKSDFVKLTILCFFGFRAMADTDPNALALCKTMDDVKIACLGVIKDASFMEESLKVCGDLDSPTATVRCLNIVANDTLELPLLQVCDEEWNDWDVIDCLREISNKTQEELQFTLVSKISRPFWVKNYGSASSAWGAMSGVVKKNIAAGQCSGWRYIRPVNPNWKKQECWSTKYYFTADNFPPDFDLGGKYKVGLATYSHCLVPYQCVTE